jgi:hypothetical protein
MNKNKSSRNVQHADNELNNNNNNNNKTDSTKKKLIKKRNIASYDDPNNNKKLKKYNLRNQNKNLKNNKHDNENYQEYLNIFNIFKAHNLKNNNNNNANYIIDVYLLYNDTLKTTTSADNFISLIETNLKELVTKSLVSSIDNNNNNELYINEFDENFFKDQNLLSLKISRNKNENQIKSVEKSFKFNYIPISNFKYDPFDIYYEKSSLIIGKVWLLPNLEYHGLWESLEFSIGVKEELLDYCNASLMFSNSQVNQKIISYNRLVLFYGEPGCGKTSLATAFSQKLSIKCAGEYKCYKLIDINSNFLLSEYYSQSGKLLTLVFQRLKELANSYPDTFYIVLIDEVETLLTSRDLHSSNTNEPLDSLRAVNVILTQLDQIKKFKNILIITTSNLSEMLDSAFLDRADLKFFIKQPSLKGIYKIYMTCINELMKKNLLLSINFTEDDSDGDIMRFNKFMFKLCKESEGLSGRLLRKLPFLAYCKLNLFKIDCFLLALLNEIRIFKENNNNFFAN